LTSFSKSQILKNNDGNQTQQGDVGLLKGIFGNNNDNRNSGIDTTN
jgi:hypothetical protein